MIPELDLRSQLLTGFEIATLDLRTQIFGDLGLAIDPPWRATVLVTGLILPVRTIGAVRLAGIFRLSGFIPCSAVVTPYHRYQTLG